MRTKLVKITVASAVFLMTAVSIEARVVDGTRFERTYETPQNRLYLKGAALLTYLFFIEAYTGALYLPEESEGAEALNDIPKHLVLEYRVGITAEDFARATTKKIEESVSREVFERILPGIDALNRLYRDVEPGDRYGLTYIPGIGTRLIYNGMPLGVVEGGEFARAVFAIWLGDNPVDTGFRDRLLGKS